VKFATHLHLVPWLGMYGVISMYGVPEEACGQLSQLLTSFMCIFCILLCMSVLHIFFHIDDNKFTYKHTTEGSSF
jgi:hypothetical protein